MHDHVKCILTLGVMITDDSVIITPNVENAQALLNLFQAWCTWSGMTIRLDKCTTFGMKTVGSTYVQSSPFLSLHQGIIPVVPPEGDFHYLGKYFSFDTTNSKVKKSFERKIGQPPKHHGPTSHPSAVKNKDHKPIYPRTNPIRAQTV